MCRVVTLVLVDGRGRVLGALAPFSLDRPYWQEVSDVVAEARARHGVDATILRILATEPGRSLGGAVSYLAQVDHAPAAGLRDVDADLSPQPNRAAFAEVGGPAASLRWAAERLAGAGRGPIIRAVQQRTWNLSAIWRLETSTATVWLKQVPRFFGHEAGVLRWLAANGPAGIVAPLVAADDEGRILLYDVPGEDLYDAGPDVHETVAGEMHEIQVSAREHVGDLLAAGVPDRRAQWLRRHLPGVVARHRADDPRLAALIAGLDARLDDLARCGLPDTLVHGDLHTGNVHGGVHGSVHKAARHVILDWGDSVIGHPAADIVRLTGRLEPADARTVIGSWAAHWRASVPGCDPIRAVELLRPIEHVRMAGVYASFLDNIEPAERAYHATDTDRHLDLAVASLPG